MKLQTKRFMKSLTEKQIEEVTYEEKKLQTQK